MARVSPSVKPLAMRPITVASRLPLRKSAIAVTISSAGRPTIGGTAVPALADAPWQPEQEEAPAGAAVCAGAGVATTIVRAKATQNDLAVMDSPRHGGKSRRLQSRRFVILHRDDVVVRERERPVAL